MGKIVKPFASYAYTWNKKKVFVGFLPTVVVLYGQIENQTFDRVMIIDDEPSIVSIINAAVHYQEGIVDKNRIKASLSKLFDDFCVSLDELEKINDIAASCDCYADAFAKKLIAHGASPSLLPQLDYRRHRPELLNTSECLHDFYANINDARLLF